MFTDTKLHERQGHLGAITGHMIYEPEFSGLGQNDFRPTLVTDQYCPLPCLYTIPSTPVMTVTIPGTHVP